MVRGIEEVQKKRAADEQSWMREDERNIGGEKERRRKERGMQRNGEKDTQSKSERDVGGKTERRREEYQKKRSV